LLPVGIVLCFQPRLLGLAGGFALTSVFVLWLIWGLFRWARSGAPAPAETRERWHAELREYGRPFIVLGVGTWLLQYADRGVVMLFFGEKQATLFSLASMLSSYVPNLVMATLMQVVFPKIFRRADQAGSPAEWLGIARDCDRWNWAFIGLASAGILLLAWQGHILVESVIGAKYRPAMHLVIPAGMAILASQANQFQFLLLQGRHNSLGMVKVTLVLAAIKTLGSLVAAAISWEALEIWLIASLFICVLAGRQMIRHFAFQSQPVAT
jgi:O-antigen/teichoic acid export membrane protein